MSDVSSALHQSEIPCSKWERLFKRISKAFRHGEHPQGEIITTFRQGSSPKESSSRESSPKRRMTLFH
jgi:hypothetical protein